MLLLKGNPLYLFLWKFPREKQAFFCGKKGGLLHELLESGFVTFRRRSFNFNS